MSRRFSLSLEGPHRPQHQLVLCPPNFQQPTNCLKSDTLSLPLYFQQLPTVKFCNSFVLITIQIAGGGWGVPIFAFRVSAPLDGEIPFPLSLFRLRPLAWDSTSFDFRISSFGQESGKEKEPRGIQEPSLHAPRRSGGCGSSTHFHQLND